MTKPANKSVIYVSRELSADSPFHNLASSGHLVIGKSAVKFKNLKVEKKLPFHNAVFFYSKKAIASFLKVHPYDGQLMYGTMGNPSAEIFSNITGKRVDLIGDGRPNSVASLVNARWRGYKVLFPIGTNSRKSLEDKALSITCTYVNCYENRIDGHLVLPECNVLVFTSPMNFRGYHQKYGYENQKVFAIGETTAKEVQNVLGLLPEYCNVPSEKNLYELVAKELIS